jgi:hypothetical protein
MDTARCGRCFKALFGIPFGPGTLLTLRPLMASWTSSRLVNLGSLAGVRPVSGPQQPRLIQPPRLRNLQANQWQSRLASRICIKEGSPGCGHSFDARTRNSQRGYIKKGWLRPTARPRCLVDGALLRSAQHASQRHSALQLRSHQPLQSPWSTGPSAEHPAVHERSRPAGRHFTPRQPCSSPAANTAGESPGIHATNFCKWGATYITPYCDYKTMIHRRVLLWLSLRTTTTVTAPQNSIGWMVLRRENCINFRSEIKRRINRGRHLQRHCASILSTFGKFVIIWQNNVVDVIKIKSVEKASIFQIFLFIYWLILKYKVTSVAKV